MATGEGSGWHHEPRRHSEAASKGNQRATHAPRHKPFKGREKLEGLKPDTPMDNETYEALLQAVNDKNDPMLHSDEDSTTVVCPVCKRMWEYIHGDEEPHYFPGAVVDHPLSREQVREFYESLMAIAR